jgi:hypothetical protein
MTMNTVKLALMLSCLGLSLAQDFLERCGDCWWYVLSENEIDTIN